MNNRLSYMSRLAQACSANNVVDLRRASKRKERMVIDVQSEGYWRSWSACRVIRRYEQMRS